MTISPADIDQRTYPISSDDDKPTIRVLLVDDDDEFATLVADYLRTEHDFTVHTETSADAALDTLDERTVSCVVSDYAMPTMNGLELLDAVKQRAPDLPFVMFAGQGSEQVASKAIQLGADDYLGKDTGEARYELLATRIENCVTIARQQQELQDIHTAIEQAGHAMLVTEADGTITYANPRMEEISGYTSEELRGNTPALLQSGEHDSEFYEDIWGTILDGDVWEGDVVNEHKEGHHYIIDQTISPIRNNGEITNFVAINRDITAEKRRERDFTFFEQAIEQLGVGITAYDSNGIIQYTNEAYATLLGSTSEALQGEHITVANPEFDRQDFESYWDSFELGETRRQETIHQQLDDDDDTTLPVETVTTYTKIGDNRYHIGTIQDITARKEREQELQKFRKAVEEAGHGIFVTDTEGIIEYVNPAFEDITGYTRDEAIGETPALLKSGAHSAEFYQDLWSTILDGDTWRGEIVNERKNGEQFVIDQTISPLTDEDGTITHFVAINRDITELKERRRQLERQNERLERFGHTVAHDLRNPLGVLEGYLDVARDAGTPDDVVNEMQTSVDRMTELIEELLALAEQGKTVLDPEPASIEDVVTTAWDHVDTREMTLEVDADVALSMDQSRVTQLLENLIRNARDHAGEDARFRVGPLEDGFYVADDGSGIPDHNRDSVLQSGFTTSEDGTGFGLAIVNQIADAHGWRVEIADGIQGGARFEFHNVNEGVIDD
jgi:PAS domain S-box-containing protein